jgi:hypothetical protein
MEPCGHTKLMNYVIGMCKKNKEWVSQLSDLGYELQIVEQTIHLSDGNYVKPDIVSSSNKLLHSLVFDVKGGKSLDGDQLIRYSKLLPEDLRWVTWNEVYDKLNLKLDVCICDLDENHKFIQMTKHNFPVLTFSSSQLSKEGQFRNNTLNEAFKQPIPLGGMMPPLSYYPFSEEDDAAYIATHVLRTLLSIALRKSKQGMDFSEDKLKQEVIEFSEILAINFNPIWKALSIEHKKVLTSKIQEITARILEKPEIKESLGIIQQKKGYKVSKNLNQFQEQAIRLIEELKSEKGQTKLSELGIF